VPYECDGLTAYRQLPLLVALPTTEEQVVAVLKLCHALRVPVVARGAGTGLSGGATPVRHGVVLSLAKFMRILDIDPLARTARVQPGVRNLAISEAVAPYGLYYAPDPSSQIACTIGGNVAENSGGVHCLKYGLTVHNVLRLRVALIDGTVVEIGSEGLDSPGYDLLALMIGSEGMLGGRARGHGQADAEAAAGAGGDGLLRRRGEGRQRGRRHHRRGHHPGRAGDDGQTGHGRRRGLRARRLRPECLRHPACESDGTPEEVAEEIAAMCAVLETSGATEIRVSQNEAERLQVLGRAQGRLPAAGPHHAGLLLHGRHHPRKHLGAC
jgi:glycolate oxidase